MPKGKRVVAKDPEGWTVVSTDADADVRQYWLISPSGVGSPIGRRTAKAAVQFFTRHGRLRAPGEEA